MIEKLGLEVRLFLDSLSREDEETEEKEGELFRSASWVITSGGGPAGAAITATKSGDLAMESTGLELTGGDMLREIDLVGEAELFEPDDELESLLVSKFAAGVAEKSLREADPVPIKLALGE